MLTARYLSFKFIVCYRYLLGKFDRLMTHTSDFKSENKATSSAKILKQCQLEIRIYTMGK